MGWPHLPAVRPRPACCRNRRTRLITRRQDRTPMTNRNKANTSPKLLSGGNPQIPKGEGDGPVQDYIAAMPGWKRKVGKRLDDLIVRTVPEVHKAVKWDQPFYGLG